MDDDGDAGVLAAGLLDLLHGEAEVDGAVALPEDDAGALQVLQGAAAQGAVGEGVVPDRHLVQGDAVVEAGVSAQVLVREEEDALAALGGPVEHLRGVGGGADDAAVAAAEGLEGGGGVDVGDRDDLGDACLAQLVPAGVDVLGVGHVGHGAAGGHVGEDDLLVGLGEDVGGLGHEVDTAEDDELGLWLLGGPLGQVEGVAAEVGELDDVLALVVVAEDDAALAEVLSGGGDAGDDLRGVQAPVLLRDVLLPEGESALLGQGAGVQGAVGGALHRLVEEGLVGDDWEGRCDLGLGGHGQRPFRWPLSVHSTLSSFDIRVAGRKDGVKGTRRDFRKVDVTPLGYPGVGPCFAYPLSRVPQASLVGVGAGEGAQDGVQQGGAAR